MRILLFILFGVLLTTSCGKKRTIVITATNVATGERYPGLEYSIVSSVIGDENGKGTKTVASGVLNSNGEAVVELREKRNRRYAVRVIEPANTCYNKSINMFFDSPNDENGHFNFEFAPCANLKLHVHNVSCFDSIDNIKFRRLWLSNNESNSFVEQIGCFQYDGDYFKLPIGNYKYEWIVTKNGITNNYESSFQLTENQYYDFQLDY